MLRHLCSGIYAAAWVMQCGPQVAHTHGAGTWLEREGEGEEVARPNVTCLVRAGAKDVASGPDMGTSAVGALPGETLPARKRAGHQARACGAPLC